MKENLRCEGEAWLGYFYKRSEFFKIIGIMGEMNPMATDEDPSNVNHVAPENSQFLFEILKTLYNYPSTASEDYVKSKVVPLVKQQSLSQCKRVLVTGGAGFVGSHLVDRLMLEGHFVLVLDNFSTGSKRNIVHWLNHPNFELIRHDITEPILLEVDEIYHLACPASPPQYQANPIKTLKTSFIGTLNLLGMAKRTGAKFLFASTSEIYGDPLIHPQSEDYWGNVNPIGPRACYDEGKRVAEALVLSYLEQENVNVRIARIFNTYGPRMDARDGRVVSNFIVQALLGQELTVYGDGLQTRSFQFIHDLIDGLIRLMASECRQPVNLGNPCEYTILTFAEMIRQKINPNLRLHYLPPIEDDPKQRKPDISRAVEVLTWEPKISLDVGLNETIAYFKQLKHENLLN